MKKNIILMSHGNMAEEVYQSAKMILGDTLEIQTVCMTANDGLEGTLKKLKDKVANIDNSDNILIIADLKGGTPANVASIYSVQNPKIKVICGLNLALVIEAAMIQEEYSKEVINKIIESGKNAVSFLDMSLLEGDE